MPGWKYEWRELTEHGLLVMPKRIGPPYLSADVNNYGYGFTTEEDAVKHYQKVFDEWIDDLDTPPELVLVRSYVPEQKHDD